MTWRVGRKVPINVYEGDRPVCQCHTAIDAKRIVLAMNLAQNMVAREARTMVMVIEKKKPAKAAGKPKLKEGKQ